MYYPIDIPNEIPKHAKTGGVTKMFAFLYDDLYIEKLLIVTFNQNENKFEYVEVDKWCAEINGPRDRLYYIWTYSDNYKVNIHTFYEFYPMIIKDFIEDKNIGAEKLIRYIKLQCYN